MGDEQPHAPDADLVRAWQAGDEAAATELVNRHLGPVHRFFATKTPEFADDLAQQTFAALAEARDRVDAQRSFRAYVLGVARHVLLRHFRHHHRHGRRFDPLETSVAALATSLSSKVAAHQRRDRVVQAMQSLPLDQQIALELYYWHDLSVAEIADVQQSPAGTIRARLTRARAKLKEQLERRDSGELAVDLESTLSSTRGGDG